MKCKNSVVKFSVNSPIGEMIVTYCVNGLHGISQIEAISDINFNPLVGEEVYLKNGTASHEDAKACINWLSLYFHNPKALSTVTVPRICKAVMSESVTYKELAAMVGNPGAVRAVGGAMANNPLQLFVPCHRVLPSPVKRATSKVGNYSGGRKNLVKIWLLQHEGLVISDGRLVKPK
ncbi:hypothetical protein B566_EDAN006856 [Ephemera danica]|nr:hypothetical protein B566_EDAN006856 [Ephemera danica]